MVVYTYDGSTASDQKHGFLKFWTLNFENCLLYTSPSPRDVEESRMPSSA